jgi:hypothetical protein
MVSILSLWLPILLAAVLVFLASAVLHMVFKYHQADFKKLPDEDAAMRALRPLGIAPGDYMMPYSHGAESMRSEEYQKKVQEGPVAVFTVLPSSAMTSMGAQLGQWFVYCAVVGVFAAYVAGRTLVPGAEYLSVFRLTGTVAFACYAMGTPQRSIWYKQNWGTTGRSMFDALIYSLLTAGAFGWLWP